MIRPLHHGLVALISLVIVLALGSWGGASAPNAAPTVAPAAPVAALAAPDPANTPEPTPTLLCSDPPMSVVSVRGDEGDGDLKFKDVAQAFLDGKNWAGIPYGIYNATDLKLNGQQQHLSITPTTAYYYDPNYKPKIPGIEGLDNNSPEGIDGSMLFFYVGHGEPTSFDALGGSASPANMLLGNCEGGGTLRYYWQLSCQVFAHGPNTGPKLCPPSGTEADTCYDNPGGASTSPGTSIMNMFDRWGPALDPRLRMACGASTDAISDVVVIGEMWRNKVKKGYDVADSFINGVWKFGRGVGLCITRGDNDMAATPLVTDLTFTNTANIAGSTRYHIEYSQPFTSQHTLAVSPLFASPYTSTVNVGTASPMPALLPIIAVDPTTPAVYIKGEQKLDLAFDDPMSEEQYVTQALGYVNSNEDLRESFYAQPEGVHLRLASTPVNREDRAKEESLQIAQKNVIVAFGRQIELRRLMQNYRPDIPGNILEVTPDRASVLGPNGGIEVQLNNDGSVRNASKIWRRVVGIKDLVKTKNPEEARKEAEARLGVNCKDMEVGRLAWGYWEAVDKVEQDTLYPYYEFWFGPKKGQTSRDCPPEVIYVSAVMTPAGNASAGTAPAGGDTVCVTGYVINHRELAVDGTQFTPPLRVEAVPAGGGPSYFADVDSNGFFKFENLPVGDYNFRMQLPPGWDGLVPTTARGGVAETGITTLEKQSDCYHIVFKIRRLFDLTVIKWEELHNATIQPSMDWEITASPVGDKFVKAQTKTTNSGGQAQFALTPGKWLISEKVKAGWIPVTPRQVTIDLDQYAPPGAIGPLIFKNHEPACYGEIIVQQRGFGTDANGNDIQLGPLAGWRVTVQRADNT